MKDRNFPVITIEEAGANAPASFVEEVHSKARKSQGKIGIFVAGVVTGAVAMAAASEIMNELNSSCDLKME